MRILLLTIFIILSALSYSQTFNSGLILGVAATQVEGDGYGGYNKLGFIGGGFTNTNLSDYWSLQFEIYFINKGSFDPLQPDKGDFDSFDFNVNYIEVPLALRFRYHRFMLEGGLYIAKFLSYSVEDEFGKREIINHPIRSFDFGGFLGIDFLLTERWIFNLRSKNSLIPFRDFQTFDQNIGILNKLFNRGWYHVDLNFSVRYQFGGKNE